MVAWAALALSLAVVQTARASTPAPAKTRYAKLHQVCPAPPIGHASCFAVVRVPVTAGNSASAGVTPYVLNDGATSSGPAGGLTPGQLASAYGYEPAAGGTGQTVAIVDAYDDPDIEASLATFDSEYGLPACTNANGCFKKVGQGGSEQSLPNADTTGWSVETSLDVETVHSVCPNCKVLLVEANGTLDTELAAAVNEAVALGATEVSNSYGGSEAGIQPAEQAAYNHPGVVIAAAAGDDGYDDWDYLDESLNDGNVGTAKEKPDAPASLPTVVAVGGTSLELNSNGTRANETVWNNDGPGDELEFPRGFVSGGGCSTLFAAQHWQQSAPGFAATGCGSSRLAADVSAVGDPYTGFDIYDGYDCGRDCEEYGVGSGGNWLTLGGTSLATPIITSLYALAGGGNGVPYPALTLYGHLSEPSSLYDVTEGGNGFCDYEPVAECGDPNLTYGRVDCEGATACNAAPGYDGPSGVGTPNGLGAFKPLFPTATIAPPSIAVAEIPVSFSAGGSSDPYPGGSIASYSWSWGDGTPNGSGVSPVHTFAKPGVYTVSVTVTDSYGLTSTAATGTVSVGDGPQEEAARRRAEQEATAKREAEAVAAATKKRQEEEAAKGGVLGAKEAGPDARIASTSLQANAGGLLSIKISCPAGETRCAGTVSLRTLNAVISSIAGTARAKPSILTLATSAFTVAGGKEATVLLHLSAKARALLARTHTLRVRVTIVAHNPAGATHTGQAIVTLHAPKASHRKD